MSTGFIPKNMPVAIFLDIPDKFINQIKYTVENLFFPYDENFIIFKDLNEFNGQQNKIIYCHEESSLLADLSDDPKTLYIILENSSIDFFSNFHNYNINDIAYFDNIPCLFPLRKQYNCISTSNIFNFDLFAASFFFLSCWQEYSIKERDGHGRVPLKSTIQYNLGIVRIPIVNEYLRIFEKYTRKLWGVEIKYIKLPCRSNLYVALSHDIDFIDWPLSKYLEIIKINRKKIDMNLTSLIGILKNVYCKKSVFNEIRDIEVKYGIASTNFFLSDYPNEHKHFAHNLIKSFDETAFEVGHHISEDIFSECSNLNSDRCKLESLAKEIYGERVHILRFEIDKLFNLLEKHSYSYDNSLLFPEDIGYRTGFTYPHYLFDPFHKGPFNVLAIPLNIMDSTLVEGKYLDLNDTSSESEILSFVDKAITYGGVLSILIHHNFFWINTEKRLQIYDNLLKYFTKSNIKVGTCRDIYFWYKEKSSKVKINTV